MDLLSLSWLAIQLIVSLHGCERRSRHSLAIISSIPRDAKASQKRGLVRLSVTSQWIAPVGATFSRDLNPQSDQVVRQNGVRGLKLCSTSGDVGSEKRETPIVSRRVLRSTEFPALSVDSIPNPGKVKRVQFGRASFCTRQTWSTHTYAFASFPLAIS
jgi:hypothetical protein